ncbi:MAG: hypothetical protein OCC45_13910 [Desulfotalea sp.]
MSSEINPQNVKPDPTNKNWTIPRTWGVWKVIHANGDVKYHKGNYPVRDIELEREYGGCELLELFTDEGDAVEIKRSLNESC